MDFEFMKPDPHLFPNISSDADVHSGFALEHKKTAGQILAEAKRLMAEHSSTDVILVSFVTCDKTVVTHRDAVPTRFFRYAGRSLARRSARRTRYTLHET
jgi:hypothetical protein